MIPSSYRRSKYYKNKIYFTYNSPTCNGKGYSVNNLFTLTTACNDVCKYLTARREISGILAGDGDRNVVISGVFLEEDQEPVSSNLNQVQEAGESVGGISGNQAGDGDRNVVISGVFLEEVQDPLTQIIELPLHFPFLDESFIDEEDVVDTSIAANSSDTFPVIVNSIQSSFLNIEQPYNFILSPKNH
ncbi:uncharacterized protein LOC135923899 [Gordionus sp. m RMFG-2023]|uniref:uncharacterized protein LOC135923899 n=1 Tax=Gordionus sp. m RMFG-2023 TaxID=3053472 RepID=UPI0031FE1244